MATIRYQLPANGQSDYSLKQDAIGSFIGWVARDFVSFAQAVTAADKKKAGIEFRPEEKFQSYFLRLTQLARALS
jgi:hypothetical protein